MPVYNEQEMIPHLRQELEKFSSSQPFQIRYILVNDGSTDSSGKMLDEWMKQSKNLEVFHLEKNMGHQQALLKGLSKASGDFIITMDADLQDPLDAVPVMVQKALEGFDVVHVRRTQRLGESMFRKCAAWTYYRIAKMFMHASILEDVGDFRLMTSRAVDVYMSRKNKNQFLRAEIVNLPLPQTVIPYIRNKRAKGKSKFTMMKLIKLSISGFFRFRSN